MYEETKSSIDWKGIFLKAVIACLIVLIALQGFKMFKGNDKKETAPSQTVADSKSSTTFALNLDKLKEAGKKYYEQNKDLLPKKEGNTSMATLSKLINEGYITSLVDENGNNCETESSYVTAEIERNKTKIKANLVCGTSYSNSSVYLSENDDKQEQTVVKNNKVVTNTKETSSTTNTKNNNSSNCKDNCGIPAVEVKTETKVEQSVIINEKPKTEAKPEVSTQPSTTKKPITTEKHKNIYVVTFDENGGSISYPSKRVVENYTVADPGVTRKTGYRFLGWYLNGEEFDFSTPIVRNITLKAKFVRINNVDDDDSSNKINLNKNTTRLVTSRVYSLMWDEVGTNKVSVSHTLRVPETVENIRDAEQVRIKKITYYSPFNTMSAVNSYEDKFNDTFYYTKTGSEKHVTSKDNLATINKNAVVFNYNDDYKDIDEAIEYGFDVSWYASYVSNQCAKTFNVVNKYTGEKASNLCAYGIVYEVTWEIKK